MTAIDMFVRHVAYQADAIRDRVSIPIGDEYAASAFLESKGWFSDTLIRDKMTGDRSQHQLLVDPSYFSAAGIEGWALFWAFEFAAQAHLRPLSRAYEETRTGAMFGSLTAAFAIFEALAGDGLTFNCYFADCKSDTTESELGADFAVVMPVGGDLFKVALFQAKNVEANGRASVERRSPKSSNIQQITRLLDVESKFLAGQNAKSTDSIFGHLSYGLLPVWQTNPSLTPRRFRTPRD